MKRLAIGILAHVDSGKTTLSEGLLYTAGEIKKLGRVDHGSAFLDTNEIEKERGITIFSKQAVIGLADAEITLLDTPGHVDFSAEMERTLPVLDYAVLVISGADGVQSHTETLWRLLSHYNVPVFVFVNKMDLGVKSKEEIMAELTERFGDGCLDFSAADELFFEEAAMLGQELMDEYLQTGAICTESLRRAISAREVFPCFFGSALKMEGVAEFLEALDKYTIDLNGDMAAEALAESGNFGARVFKISEDERGQRLTHMKITHGSLKVKDFIEHGGQEQKINDIRIYSGVKYKSVPEVFAGNVCAVPGLSGTFPGEGFGSEPDAGELVSEPVFTYSVILPEGVDTLSALAVCRRLEEEETKMNVLWNEKLQTINVQVMGEVQLEVLKRILEDRFGLRAEFGNGSIIYMETIAEPVIGVGHYEPLRHYAEVHLLLEPGARGSGIVTVSGVSEDVFEKNWQKLVLGHIAEKAHIGVLTGSPITDIKITLVAGRGSKKHTEGGDFRQATYRALRQGLMNAENILLEPWYDFVLEVPLDTVGRAMTDLQQMGAKFAVPETKGEMSVITGQAPVAQIRDYHKSIVSYTHGRGRLNCTYSGYEPCVNAEEVISEIGYDPELDIENSPDSVFCYHGAGQLVKWYEVYSHMQIPMMSFGAEAEQERLEAAAREAERRSSETQSGREYADEDELRRIFERTYGKIKETRLERPAMRRTVPEAKYRGREKPAGSGPLYLLIDGYNIIFAWDDLKKTAEESLDLARTRLIDRIGNYQAYKQINVIIVFDAYRVKDAVRKIEKVHGLTVVYTKEAETADQYIEKTSKVLSKDYRVRVATSDNLEQVIILGHGANRVSAPEFLEEVRAAEKEMQQYLK